jgi:ketosteroid isomerase-like protein
MKKTACALLLAFSGAAWAAGPAETVEAFHRALAGTDQKAVLAFLSEDADVFEQGFVDASRDDYARNSLTAEMAFAARTRREVQSQQSQSSGDLAFVETLSRVRGAFAKDKVDFSGAETVILRKDDGAWKIIHVHRSAHETRMAPKAADTPAKGSQ